MALITKDQLITLDYSVDGQPFVEVTASGSADTTLDLVYSGQPFIVTATSGGGGPAVKEGAAALTAIAAQTVVGNLIKVASATVNSTATQTASGERLRRIDAAITSTASLTADAEVIPAGVTVEASGSWSAAASLSALISKTIQLGTPGTRTPKTVTPNGNAQISTVQKKFGAASAAFDGSGDYLKITTNTDFAFSTSDFTVEGWIRPAVTTGVRPIIDFRSGSANNILIYLNGTDIRVNSQGATVINGAAAITSTTQWYHIALAKSGSSTKLYVNGVQVGSTYTDNNTYVQSSLLIGVNTILGSYFSGYIDDVRITKGLARYTSNFTAPTQPFTGDANTVLLLHLDTDFSDDVGFSPETLSSQFSVSATASVIRGATSAMTVTASVSATISHIEGADLFAFTEALLAVEVSRIRDNNVTVSDQFTVATDASRIVHFGADDFALATVLVGDNLRVRYSQAATEAAFALTADIELIPGGDVVSASGTWSSEFAIDCKASKKANIVDADISVDFQQTAQAERIAGLSGLAEVNAAIYATVVKTAEGQLAAAAQIDLTATISHIHGADLSAFTDAALTTSFDVIRSAASDSLSEFAQSVTADVTRETSATLTATGSLTAKPVAIIRPQPSTDLEIIQVDFTLTAATERIAGFATAGVVEALVSADVNAVLDNTSNLLVDTTSELTALRIQSASADFTGAFTPVLDASAIISNFAILESQFTSSAVAVKTADTGSTTSTEFNLTASGLLSKEVSAVLSSNFALAANVEKLKVGASQQSAQFALTASGFISNRRPRQTSNVRTTSISTVQSVLGGASLYAPSGAYVSYSSSGDYLIKQDKDFQLELFFYPTSVASTSIERLLSAYFGATELWSVSYGNRFLRFNYLPQAGAIENISSPSQWFLVNQWHYIRVVKTNTGIQLQGAIRDTSGVWSGITTLASTGAVNLYNPVAYTSARLEIGDINTGAPGYFDEVFLSNNSTRQQFAVGTTPNKITAGKEDTTIALFHYDVDYSDDMTGTLNAQAALSATASVTASAILSKSTSAVLNSILDQTAVANKTASAASDLVVEGFELAVGSRTREFRADLTAQLDLTALGGLVKPGDTDINITSALTADLMRVVVATSNLTSTADLTLAFDRTRDFTSNQNVLFTPTIDVRATKIGDIDLFVDANMAAVGNRTADYDADLTTDSTQTTVNDRIRFADSAITSAVTLTAQVDDVDLATADLTATTSLTVDFLRVNLASANLSTTSTLTASAVRIVPPWKVEVWYRGITGSTSTQILYADPYTFEVGLGSTGFNLTKRYISTGIPVWKKAIPIVAGTAGNVNAQYYNGKIYLQVSRSTVDSRYVAMLVINPDTAIIESTWAMPEFSSIADIAITGNSIYVSGNSGLNASISKYSLTGVNQWRRRVALGVRDVLEANEIQVQNGAVYWRLQVQQVNQNTKIIKVNASTGATIWVKDAGFANFNGALHVDSQDNMYLMGTTLGGTTSGVIAKINSLGTTVWAKRLSGSWYADGYLTVDDQSNVYIVNAYVPAFGANLPIVKLNSSGQVQWSRKTETNNINSYGFDFAQPTVVEDRLLVAGNFHTPHSIVIDVPTSTGGEIITGVDQPDPIAGTWGWIDAGVTATSVDYALSDTTETLVNAGDLLSSASAWSITDNTNQAITYLYIVSGKSDNSAQFTQNTQPTRILGLPPQNLTVTATQTTQARKDAVLALQNMQTTASVAVTYKRLRSVDSSTTVNSTLTANPVKVTVTTASLEAPAVLTAQPYDFTKADADIQSQVSLTADNLRVRYQTVDTTADTTLAEAVTKIAQGVIATEAISITLEAVNKIGQGFVDCRTESTLTADVIITSGSAADLTSTAELTATPWNVVTGNLTVASEFTQDSTEDYLRRNESNMQATAELSVPGQKVTDINSNSLVTATITANTDRSKLVGITAELSSQLTLTADNQILRLASADLVATATIPFALPGVVVRYEAHLLVNGFTLTAGRIVHLDPYYQIVVDSETRSALITPESRILAIKEETRVNIIKGTQR